MPDIVVDIVSNRKFKYLRFESSVISYGNQAIHGNGRMEVRFESSVISYGNQAF